MKKLLFTFLAKLPVGVFFGFSFLLLLHDTANAQSALVTTYVYSEILCQPYRPAGATYLFNPPHPPFGPIPIVHVFDSQGNKYDGPSNNGGGSALTFAISPGLTLSGDATVDPFNPGPGITFINGTQEQINTFGFFQNYPLSSGNYEIDFCFQVTPPTPTPTVTPTPTPTVTPSGQSIRDLDFELSSGNAGWWQAIGEDVRYNPTYDNNAIANVNNQTCTPPPPAPANGAYAIMDENNSSPFSPGIFFTGQSNPFATGNASANSNNWLVTNETDINNPDTEFNRLYKRIKNNNASLIDATYFNGNISSFPSSAKVYIVDPCANASGSYNSDTYNPTPCSQTVTLGTVGGSHLSASALTNYIFLINGNLQINNTLRVPVGSTALFSVSGKITVDSSIGGAPSTACSPNHDEIDGTFVAGQDFDIPSGHTCPVADSQLVISGSIITDAQGSGGYSFHTKRSLCSSNTTTPAVIVRARPDFILNAPELIKTPDTSYQELAPM